MVICLWVVAVYNPVLEEGTCLNRPLMYNTT